MEPDPMEHGKLERMQRALEQCKPLAEFLNSSEWDAFWQPAKTAISRGDETRIWTWGGGPNRVRSRSGAQGASECEAAGRGHTSSETVW